MVKKTDPGKLELRFTMSSAKVKSRRTSKIVNRCKLIEPFGMSEPDMVLDQILETARSSGRPGSKSARLMRQLSPFIDAESSLRRRFSSRTYDRPSLHQMPDILENMLSSLQLDSKIEKMRSLLLKASKSRRPRGLTIYVLTDGDWVVRRLAEVHEDHRDMRRNTANCPEHIGIQFISFGEAKRGFDEINRLYQYS